MKIEQIGLFNQAMVYERAFSEALRVRNYIRDCQHREIDKGETDPEMLMHYDILAREVQDIANKMQQLSDDAFKAHKAMNPFVQDSGIDNLSIAVIKQACSDYARAICDDDESVINEIKEFARSGDSSLYSDANLFRILRTIDEAKERFAEIAKRRIDDIIRVTNTAKHDGRIIVRRSNKNRCPLCGGGMYVRGTVRNRTATVGCTGCELHVRIKF